MQKEKKNVRIPNLNKISRPCLENIIQASDIDEERLLDALRCLKMFLTKLQGEC